MSKQTSVPRHLKIKHVIEYDVRKTICSENTDNLDLEENIDNPNTVLIQQNTSETQNQPSFQFLTFKITHTSIKTSQSIKTYLPKLMWQKKVRL